MREIAKWKLIVWIFILISALVFNTWALFNVKPKNHVDCKAAMAAWNYEEGQAAIAAFKGQDKRATLLKEDYRRLVLGPAHVCFPPDLIDYIVQN